MSGNGLESSVARVCVTVDHADMMEQIDRIETLMAAPEPDLEQISHGLAELIEASRLHFERESGIMGCLDAAEAEAHRADHCLLLKTLTDYADTVRSGEAAVVVESALDLKLWLVSHIQRFDAALIAAAEG